MRLLALASFLMLILSRHSVGANTVKEFHFSATPPKHSHPVVIFASRSGTVGHAYVATGWRSDVDGKLTISALKGFYPEGNDQATMKAMIYSPPGSAEVTATIKDMQSFEQFEVNVTEPQITIVESIFSKFERQGYSVLVNNCTDMVDAVANSLGLQTMPLTHEIVGTGKDRQTIRYPATTVRYIKSKNTANRPLEYAAERAKARERDIEADTIIARDVLRQPTPEQRARITRIWQNQPVGADALPPMTPQAPPPRDEHVTAIRPPQAPLRRPPSSPPPDRTSPKNGAPVSQP